MHMSRQTAYKFKSIAEDTILSNDAHGRHLPPSWRASSMMGVNHAHAHDLKVYHLQQWPLACEW
jgi:hypothetical protein